MKSLGTVLMAAALALAPLAARAAVGGGGPSLPGGGSGPTTAVTPVAAGTPSRGDAVGGVLVGSALGTQGLRAPAPSDPDATERALAAHREMLTHWTTWVEATQPGFVAIGAARELPFGFHAAGSTGMFIVAPMFEGELQPPSVHVGGARLYAAGAYAWMYVPRTTIKGDSARAWGFGPKIGVEWRLPMRDGAQHGWHVGADVGVLFGDWSTIFGATTKKDLVTFTPFRLGYYWN